jgi:hypothetical protein
MPELGSLVPNNLGPTVMAFEIAFDAQYDCIGLRGLEATANIKSFYSYLFAK